MKIARRLAIALLCATAVWGEAAASADHCTGLLPRPSRQAGEETCTYVNVPFSTFVYEAGQFRASWPAAYRVTDAVIVADGEIVANYEPGKTVALALDPAKRYYEIRGYARAGEGKVRFLSPVWDRRYGLTGDTAEGPNLDSYAAVTTAPTETVSPTSCSLTESTVCEGGGLISVSCNGDSGSCSGCSTETTACCSSRTRKVFSIEGGTVTTTEETRKEKTCPAPAEPSPREPVR